MSDHVADLIVKNANIITVDKQNPIAESFAVKNGRFISIGTDNDMEMLSTSTTKIIDLEGMTVIPGFIDAHIHVLSSGTMHVMAADCDQRSIKDIVKILRARVEETKSYGWIQGFKFDDTKTVENRFLTRKDLDLVSKELPVFVTHRAGHVYFLNSLSLIHI